jgi:hypothetical protein
MKEDDPEELSRVLAKKYVDYGLKDYPFAVTGYLCLGRGITFQSSGFLFDYGIIPAIVEAAEAYQCAARVLGNIGAFATTTPTIYMDADTATATMRQERIAKHIARLVHENEWVDVGVEEIAQAAGDPTPPQLGGASNAAGGGSSSSSDPSAPPPRRDHRIYSTEEEARKALKHLYPDYRWRTRSKNGSFYEAAVGGPAQIHSLEHVLRRIPNLTGGKGKTATMTHYVPCYTSITDPSTLRYVIVLAKDLSDEAIAELDKILPEI